jgi:hypothetical protein
MIKTHGTTRRPSSEPWLRGGDPVQGAPAELFHPLIYTQEGVWRLVTLFSSRRLRLM